MDDYNLTTTSEMMTISTQDMSMKENNDSRWTTLNASSETPVLDYSSLAPLYQAEAMLWKVCSPVILALGTFGNIMTLLILQTMPLGTGSVSVFFSALAVSDIVLLYTGLVRQWILRVAMVEVRNFHDVVCKVHMFLVYLSAMTSAWFLVTMTLQRVTSVLWPHRVALICTRRKAQVTMVFLVLLLASLNSPILVTYTVRTTPTTPTPECLSVDDKNLVFFDSKVYPWIDLVITSLLPSLLLLLGNSALSVTLYGSVHQTRLMTTEADTITRKKAASSLTITLICVSVTYLCLTLPVCVFAIAWEYVYYEAWMDLAWAVCNLLWYCNAAINFYLYCLTGSKFRAQCRRLLCLPVPRDARAVSTSVLTKTTNQPRSVLGQNRDEQQDREDF